MNVVEKKQEGSQVSYTIKKEMVDFIKKIMGRELHDFEWYLIAKGLYEAEHFLDVPETPQFETSKIGYYNAFYHPLYGYNSAVVMIDEFQIETPSSHNE